MEEEHRSVPSIEEIGASNGLHKKIGLERKFFPRNCISTRIIKWIQIFSKKCARPERLIVTGTSQARGLLRHYIMGDLTRGILNRANCPVLVARAGKPTPTRTLWTAFKGLLRRR